MATLEQIIAEARALSPAEKLKLRQALDRELEQAAPAQSRTLEGDTLIAQAGNAREVYLAARQAVHITPKTDAYIGGWYGGIHQLDFETFAFFASSFAPLRESGSVAAL